MAIANHIRTITTITALFLWFFAGDTIGNLIDGIAIANSFLIAPAF